MDHYRDTGLSARTLQLLYDSSRHATEAIYGSSFGITLAKNFFTKVKALYVYSFASTTTELRNFEI